MTNNKLNPKVDELINSGNKWAEEFNKLRNIALGCDLTEELKWRLPCYTFQNKNIVIIQDFKDYCAIMFFKGALLKDTNEILSKPGEHSQAQRQIRFINVQEIVELESVIKNYILEAIKIEESGLKVDFKATEEYAIPEELKVFFDENPALQQAFESLTPGRQRAYIHYFSKPKQSKTRQSRIEKYKQHILEGKGLND